MAKVEHLIQRADGSEVKIVAEAFYGSGLTLSIGTYVLRRDNPDQNWQLTSDRPHPDWKKMPRADYVKFGRSEMLRTASIGEILKAGNALRASLVH